MRISTNTIYELGVTSIQQQQVDLIKTQQQLASGKRVLTPSDDPIAAARALEIGQTKAIAQQYSKNADTAQSSLQLEESALNGVVNLIQDVRQRVVNSGDPGLSSSDLQAFGSELSNSYQQLLSLANSTDGDGKYLFSGFAGGTKPFTQSSGAGVYAGDQGQRTIQIGTSRNIEVSDSGQNVFKPGVSGQDLFQTIDTIKAAFNGGSVTSTQIDTALNGLDAALTNVSKVRSAIGARLSEIDSVKTINSDLDIQYSDTLSNLQDVDYTKAISDLSKQQVNLEAAQKSYVSVTQLSLFNYIGG
jgi:flagellar hook-associated protein 3 FlgL